VSVGFWAATRSRHRPVLADYSRMGVARALVTTAITAEATVASMSSVTSVSSLVSAVMVVTSVVSVWT